HDNSSRLPSHHRPQHKGHSMRIVLCFALLLTFAAAVPAQEPPMVGIDSNYALDMAARKKSWSDRSGPVDPVELLAKNGCRGARIRLWVGDEGVNKLNYATETARRAQQA